MMIAVSGLKVDRIHNPNNFQDQGKEYGADIVIFCENCVTEYDVKVLRS